MKRTPQIAFFSIFVIVFWGIVLKLNDERKIIELNKMAAESAIREKVRKAGGGTAVLQACRQVIDEFMVSNDENTRVLDETDESKLPKTIQRMDPSAICVESDEVMLLFETPGFRTALLAFSDGVDQYGTSLITNGLWYWTFHPSRDTYKTYQKKLSMLEHVRPKQRTRKTESEKDDR